MKKLSLLASLVFALAAAAHAQFEGIGWDGLSTGGTVNELVARVGIGGYSHVEVGGSFFYNNDATGDDKANVTVSGRFLLALHNWEKFTGYLHAGAYFRDDSPGDNEASLNAKVAYQPEVVLIPHVAVNLLFGASMNLIPEFQFATIGDRISIVDGLNFRILF
jgi:hypothetical protein